MVYQYSLYTRLWWVHESLLNSYENKYSWLPHSSTFREEISKQNTLTSTFLQNLNGSKVMNTVAHNSSTGHFMILIKGVRNTQNEGLSVENDDNSQWFR